MMRRPGLVVSLQKSLKLLGRCLKWSPSGVGKRIHLILKGLISKSKDRPELIIQMKIQGVAILLLVSVAVAAQSVQQGKIIHKCAHDKLFKNKDLKVMEDISDAEFKRRFLQINSGAGNTGQTTGGSTTQTGTAVNDGWHLLRIFVDYSYANQLIASNSGLSSRYQMSIRLVESVRTFWQNALMVNFMPTMTFSGGSCYNNKIPSFQMPIDLFITLYPQNDPSTDYFAAATPCYLSSRDGRPTVGAYILNFAFLQATAVNEYLYFSTFAHEFTHILGFSNDLFPRYVNPQTGAKRQLSEVVGNVNIGGNTFQAIILPDVVNTAQRYIGCSSITGVPLEDNGGDGSAGSHWEKTFLPLEYMNPTVENPGILSVFTMSLLQATGWYQVRSIAAQPYTMVQNAGCGLFQICPQGGTGLCSASQVGQTICAPTYMSKVVVNLTVGNLHSRQDLFHGMCHQEIKSSLMPSSKHFPTGQL